MRCSFDMNFLLYALALNLLLLNAEAHKKALRSSHLERKSTLEQHRDQDLDLHLHNVNNPKAKTKTKTRIKTHSSKFIKRDSGHVVAIASEGEFYVELAIGTPPQRFLVQPDTGSPDTWLPTIDCQSCSSFKRLFNYTASSTSSYRGGHVSRNDFTIIYDDNDSVRGTWVRETLTIGAGPLRGTKTPMKKLKIPRAVLGLIRWESGSWLDQKVDGVLGLSLSSPILRNILDVTSNGIGAYRFFTVRFNSLMGTSSYEFSSRLDLPMAKAASYLPVIDNEQGDWLVNLSMSFKTRPGIKRQFAGIIDTGTNLLAVEQSVAHELVKALTFAITGTDADYTKSQVRGGVEFAVPCPGRKSSVWDKTIARLYLGTKLALPIRVRDLVTDTQKNYWTGAELDAQYADQDDTWNESDQNDTQDETSSALSVEEEDEEILEEILPYRPRSKSRKRHLNTKRDTIEQREYCVALLDVVQDGDPAIIGDVVLKRLVTVFHEGKKRVGFALNKLE